MAYYKIEKGIDEVCRIVGVREYVHDYVREYSGMTMAARVMKQQADGFAECGYRNLDRLASLIIFSEQQNQLWQPMYTSANFLSKTIVD